MKATKILRAALPPLVSLVLVLALWEIVVRARDVPAFLLPPPSAIARAAWRTPECSRARP